MDFLRCNDNNGICSKLIYNYAYSEVLVILYSGVALGVCFGIKTREDEIQTVSMTQNTLSFSYI